MRIALILLLAHLFARYQKRIEGQFPGAGPMQNLKLSILLPGVLLAPILLLLLLEPHHSAMILMCCIAASIMLVGGALLRWFFLAGGVAVTLISLLLVTRGGYVAERLQAGCSPSRICRTPPPDRPEPVHHRFRRTVRGGHRQQCAEAHVAARGPERLYFRYPVRRAGFCGRGNLHPAVPSSDRAGDCDCMERARPVRQSAGGGLYCQISFQFLFNVAVVTNTIPNTGISLPFFSSGGTSLLMLLGQMGVVMSVCRAGNRKKADEKAAAEQEKQAQAINHSEEKAQQSRTWAAQK